MTLNNPPPPNNATAAQPESEDELTAMLLRAVKSIGVEVNTPSSPKRSSVAGQAASALHAIAILQIHQAKALKNCTRLVLTEVMQELRTASDFALRAMKVMSTMVVQEHHLWLNLAQMSDADKVCFLEAPISQAGLFGDTVKDFAQQFSAVQKQTETTSCPGI
ncbi:hypothetical protein M9458_047067, partial [Cirrhinus mrigala]